MHLLPYLTLSLAVGTSSVLAASAQLRLSPDPSSSSRHERPVTLTAPQANAVLAHHLGVAQYERFSVSNGGDDAWQQALGRGDVADNGASSPQWSVGGQKVVLVIECGQHGCDDVIPQEFSQSQAYELPSLPLHSWTSAITLHLHRLAASLGLKPDSRAILGLDQLTESIKTVAGWAGWVGEELGNAIGWDQIKQTVKAAVEPVRSSLGLLTDVDMLDQSAETLILELESLSNIVDGLAAASASGDDAPQVEKPQAVALHLKGLKDVAAAHSRSSEVYQRAASLLRQTISATLSALRQDAATNEEPTLILLTLPPYSPPMIRRRAPFLAAFGYTPIPGQVARRAAPMQFPRQQKRASVFVDHSDDGRRKRAPEAEGKPRQPVVPSGHRCFESEEQLNNLTASCLGRGKGVKGISAAKVEGDCWVCACGKTTEEGKTRSWAGQGCEKEDLSGDFVLLFFSGVGLISILVVSVYLLYGVGNAELPGTLSSVSGAGVGSKRD